LAALMAGASVARPL